MAHIHDLIDFTVAAYIVHKKKVLFIHHKKLNRWLPIGGHIELGEEPEEALYREIEEESGISRDKLTVLTSKPNIGSMRQKFLLTPNLLDIHSINETHRHVCLIYFVLSKTHDFKLAEEEHHDIKWLDKSELKDKKYELTEDVLYGAEKALEASLSDK